VKYLAARQIVTSQHAIPNQPEARRHHSKWPSHSVRTGSSLIGPVKLAPFKTPGKNAPAIERCQELSTQESL